MTQRFLCASLFIGSALTLTSCQALTAPFGMMNRMLQAGGRTIGMGAENDRMQPLRLETGEIERARAAEQKEMLPAPEMVEAGEQVAVVR